MKLRENQNQQIEYIYSDDAIKEGSMVNLSQEDYEAMKEIEGDILRRLQIAVREGIRTNCKEGVEIARLHKKWLSYIWEEYKTKYHLQIADKIVDDEKLRTYYDKECIGCADFLRNAIRNYIYKEEKEELPKTDLNK